MELLASSNAVPLELRRLGHRGDLYRHPVGSHFRGLAKKMGILDDDLEDWFVKRSGLDNEHGATVLRSLPTGTMEITGDARHYSTVKVHGRLLPRDSKSTLSSDARLLSARGQKWA